MKKLINIKYIIYIYIYWIKYYIKYYIKYFIITGKKLINYYKNIKYQIILFYLTSKKISYPEYIYISKPFFQ